MQTAENTDDTVIHNEQKGRFQLDVDNRLAHADYRREGSTLVFYHTYVPETHRGKGYAARVVRAGLEYARSHDLTVVPQCSFVSRYIERHPEYQSLVAPH